MPSRSSSNKSKALLAQGAPYQTSWERVQEATLVSEALYRIRPEFREEERQLFEKLHGKTHLSLQDPERRKVYERYETIGNFKKSLTGLARLSSPGYAPKRAEIANDLGVDEDRLDAEVEDLRQTVPRGLPLPEREQYPDILDAREIAGLLADDPDIRESYYGIITSAVANKKLVSVGSSMGSELDLGLVYRDVTRRLRELEQTTGVLSRRVDELQYQNAVLRNRIKVLEAELPRGRRRLPEGASRPPIPGSLGISCSVRKQWHAPMLHRDEFAKWLETEDISIPAKAKLQGWLKSTRSGPRTRIINLRRAVTTARVTLIVRKGGVEPSADEVFDFLAADDPTGIIVDADEDKLVWQATTGDYIDAKRKTVANMLSKVKKENAM